MLTSRLVSATATTAIVAVLLPVTAQAAPAPGGVWSHVGCGQGNSPECEVLAGQNSQNSATGAGSRPAAPAGDGKPICSYTPVEDPATLNSLAFRPNEPAGSPLAPGSRYYLKQCEGQAPGWVLLAPGVLPPPPSPRELAVQARSRLRPPRPVISSSPSATQLVNLPTWLWTERANWHPVSATAGVPALSVTAIAMPNALSFSTGDGTTIGCAGPGTPFSGKDKPAAASPDCGHTYRAASRGRGYPVSATIRWRITWSGGGESGSLPDLTTAASVTVPVEEAHSLSVR
ncbi:hypothetical protein M8C13_08895 [Crossiella sp. SN42]|uniref:hypothetical protein n=1 Tax=Crossiella sp. SN42 TaxID=2944808 RepID=UPI00207D59BA|nr:hypothetical protein [Crossiella sp. SN42]MCO1575873.1 hypothetical protein [Crossiella sp. SN42]